QGGAVFSKSAPLYNLALKCLAEFESFIDRQYRRKRLEMLHRDMEAEIEAHWDAVDWVYRYLRDEVLSGDKDRLKVLRESFENISRLSRPVFLERYLGYDKFFEGDSEIVGMREELLLKIMKRDVVDQWLAAHRLAGEKEFEKEGELLTLDFAGYHPEDKNFKYYREYTGEVLIGFLGSPNLKHSDIVTCVDVSPDGKWILSGSYDHTLKLWDINTGTCIKTIPLLWIPVEIKPHPDHPGLFATANANCTVTFFDFREILNL
ncbi:MAG: hypothetical protein JSV88_21895, partial [Candidatus Aminicenantes bacterium]